MSKQFQELMIEFNTLMKVKSYKKKEK